MDEAALRPPGRGPGRHATRSFGHLAQATAGPARHRAGRAVHVRRGHAGRRRPSFSILRFDQPDLPDVVYIEQLTSGLVPGEPAGRGITTRKSMKPAQHRRA